MSVLAGPSRVSSRIRHVSQTVLQHISPPSRLPTFSRWFSDSTCRRRETFSTPVAPAADKWDNVYTDLPRDPPHLGTNIGSGGTGPRLARRKTMTAQEIRAFNEVFNLIFEAMAKNTRSSPSAPVDIAGSGMGELFGRLRRHSRRAIPTAEIEEELDRKKEEMDGCTNDQELLTWALQEVFEESRSYEAAFRKARSENAEELPDLQPPAYPYLIALLMQIFRDKYRDPHLALSMFDYARQMSVPSYVFGCSTRAYNELITTRWKCFQDLKGVHDALDEMSVNGVDMDSKTLALAEGVRRDVSDKSMWIEENEVGSRGVWDMLSNIDGFISKMAASPRNPASRKRSSPWNRWKGEDEEKDVDWGFNKW